MNEKKIYTMIDTENGCIWKFRLSKECASFFNWLKDNDYLPENTDLAPEDTEILEFD